MIDFTQNYSRRAWLSFLEDYFLPEDFCIAEKPVDFSETLAHTQTVTELGKCDSLRLTVFEIKHTSTKDARTGLSKDAFRIVRCYTNHSRALILFVPQNSDAVYRFSLVEITPNNTECIFT